MIISVCLDDPTHTTEIGRKISKQYPEVYGSCHRVFDAEIPQIAPDENLFLIAHGAAAGDEDQPVIGDKFEALYLNAHSLWGSIASLFPDGYHGNVYVSACETADIAPGQDLSFAEAFAVQIKSKFGDQCQVFGRRGGVRGIPLPTDTGWIQASFD